MNEHKYYGFSNILGMDNMTSICIKRKEGITLHDVLHMMYQFYHTAQTKRQYYKKIVQTNTPI